MTNIQALDVAEEKRVFVMNDDQIARITGFLDETAFEEFNKTESKAHKGIFNITKDELACVASDAYHTIQHREVVPSVLKALDNLNIKNENTLRVDGHRIFMDINFPHEKLTVVGEEFTCGFRMINSYDRTTGLLILPRIERLKCTNGMVIKRLIPGYQIRHTQKLVEDFQGFIEKALKMMINSDKKLQVMVENCIADSVEWSLVETIMNNLITRKNHIEGIMGKLEHTDHVTRWDIYNALTDYATHGEQLKPNVEMWLQNKAQALLEKPLAVYSKKILVEA